MVRTMMSHALAATPPGPPPSGRGSGRFADIPPRRLGHDRLGDRVVS
jgi:hypothetical protein